VFGNDHVGARENRYSFIIEIDDGTETLIYHSSQIGLFVTSVELWSLQPQQETAQHFRCGTSYFCKGHVMRLASEDVKILTINTYPL